MEARLTNQRSPDSKFSVRYTKSFPIMLAATQIDLYQWITEMTQSDYTSYSKVHLAMSSHFKNGSFFMTNVENIGTDMVIQHYELAHYEKSHILLYSSHTVAYILRWFPVVVGVPWEMQIRPISHNSCELICLVGADYPNPFIQTAAWVNGLSGLFLKRHLKKEGLAFAKDIASKFTVNSINENLNTSGS